MEGTWKKKYELSFPQKSTSLSHTDGLRSVCDIRQPLPAHIKLMYLIQILSSFFTFTAQNQVLGKQTNSITWHYRHSRTGYEIIMWLIKNITVRWEGGNKWQVLQIFTHTQFTHHQSIIWRQLKDINTQNQSKMYLHSLIWMKLTSH